VLSGVNLDTFAIQVLYNDAKLAWLSGGSSLLMDYLFLDHKISEYTLWFDSKLDAQKYIQKCDLKSGSNILEESKDGKDKLIKAESFRIVRIEVQEV
jgi:hypothetical protein